MKTQRDPRHERRIAIMQLLYGLEYQPKIPDDTVDDIKNVIARIAENTTLINTYIDQYAKSFLSDRMSKIDLAILQLGVYELLIDKKEPYRVVLDEAIELAKEYGASNSPKFINGILGNIVEQQLKKTDEPQKT